MTAPRCKAMMRQLTATGALLAMLAAPSIYAQQPRAAATEQAPVEQQFQKGVEALKSGRLDEAEKLFQQLLASSPGAPGPIHHNLGIVYQQKHEHARAVEQFRQAVELSPDDAAPRTLLGVSLRALGKNQEAITQFEKAVDLDRNKPEARLQLALAYEVAGNTPQVVEQLRALRKLEPNEPEHAYRLGKAYVDLAAWSTRKMMEIQPQSPRVYQILGENYLVQGNLDLAERNLSRAAELGAALPGVHWLLAQVYLKRGNKEAALKALDQELAVMPGSVMALRMKQQLAK